MISYRDGDAILQGVLCADAAQRNARPGILLVHGGAGLDEHARAQAERLAALGYVVLACDMFGEGVAGDRDRTMAAITGLVSDPERLCRRAQAGLGVLTAHPQVDGRVAAVGYCFGGTTALELARAGAAVSGVASIHGGLRRLGQAAVAPISARVLVCHGGSDPHVPPADVAAFVDEMTADEADWQMHAYRGVAHGFTHRRPSSTTGCGLRRRRRHTLVRRPAAVPRRDLRGRPRGDAGPQLFFSRHARSNGSRHAFGAMSWWIALGPHVPGG